MEIAAQKKVDKRTHDLGHVLMAFLLGFISIISSLLLLFMKALTTN
jgi:hypothetical protein